MSAALAEIESLFAVHGDESYGEGVTMLQHALEAAALAASEGADDALVVAALLHDVGHFLQPTDDSFGYHRHDKSGGDWLAKRFGPEVSEPVRLHVAAKRYLCAVDPGYAGKLSPASTYTLSKQGGPMSPAEVEGFEALPHWRAAVRLRRWDDGGKIVGLVVREFSEYRSRIAGMLAG